MDFQPSMTDSQALDTPNDATDTGHTPNSITALLDACTIRTSQVDHDAYIPSKKYPNLLTNTTVVNYHSALQYSDAIVKYIAKEQSFGTILGLYSTTGGLF